MKGRDLGKRPQKDSPQSSLFGAQPANFPNMSHHRLVYMLRLIVQTLREPILIKLSDPRELPQFMLHSKKSPVAFS